MVDILVGVFVVVVYYFVVGEYVWGMCGLVVE